MKIANLFKVFVLSAIAAMAMAAPASSQSLAPAPGSVEEKLERNSVLLRLHATAVPEGEQRSGPSAFEEGSAPLLTQPLTARIAIRLDEDMPAVDHVWATRGLVKQPMPAMPAGTLLYGRERTNILNTSGRQQGLRATLYCVNVHVPMMGKKTGIDVRCLVDTDHNGTLDVFGIATSLSNGSDRTQLVFPIAFTGAKLPSSVRYTAVPIDNPTVTGASVQIRWRYASKKKQTRPIGDGVQIEVFYQLNCSAAAGIDCSSPSSTQLITVEPGKDVHATVWDSDITILGFTDAGELRYLVNKPIPSQDFSIRV
jgi:hypothetical protein